LTFEPTPAYPPSPGAPAAGVDAPEESHGPAAPDLLDPGTPPVPVPADLPGALPAPALPGGAAAGGTGAPGSAAAWPAALAAPLEALTALYHEAAFGPPHRRPGTGAALRAREAARALARGLRREMGWYRYLGAAAAARLAPEAVPEGSHPPGDAAQRPIPRS